MSKDRCWASQVLLLACFCIPDLSALERVVLEPAQDNTLYETLIDQDGQQYELSNGAGSSLFAGRTGLDAGYKRRRALLQFDLASSLPSGAEIVFAELSLYQSKAAPGSPPVAMELHRVLESWGEGASNAFGPEGQGNPAEANDATWHHSHYADVLWEVAGGHYQELPSASTIVGQALGPYLWACSESLVVDLRYWQSNPEQNYGWILVGGEAGGFSAHRFSSRENTTSEQRPRLTIVYRQPDEIFEDDFEEILSCSGNS
jgi:hypothetical protein